MINDAQNTIFENMKKRLTNPFLFTYFWVFVSWNINKILVLMYEPMKMSDKLKMYEGQWSIALPFLFAFFMVTLFSYLDVFVDFVKRNADSFNKKVLVKFDFEKIVITSEYEEIVKHRNSLRKELAETQDMLIKYKAQVQEENPINIRKNEIKNDESDNPTVLIKPSNEKLLNPFLPVEEIELSKSENGLLYELFQLSGEAAECHRSRDNFEFKIELKVGEHKVVSWDAAQNVHDFWTQSILNLEQLGLINLDDNAQLWLTQKGKEYAEYDTRMA
jgi:hypothetical protein